MSKALDIFRRNPKPDVIIGRFSAFHLEYHRNHVVGSNLLNTLHGGLMNMRLLPTKERWEARDRNTLWWWVGSLKHFERECVKRHQVRRLRHAFKGALQTLGYDEEGNSTAAGLHEARNLVPLRGSVQLRVKKEAIDVKYTDMQRDLVRGLQQVVEMARKFEGGQQKRPSRPYQKGRLSDNYTGAPIANGSIRFGTRP